MITSLHFRGHKNKKYPVIIQAVCHDHVQEHVDRHRGMTQYQFFYTISGSGEFCVNGQRMISREGQAMVLLPFEAHSYKAVSPGWRVHVFLISGACVQEIMSAMGVKQSGIYNVSEDDIFDRYMQRLLDVSQSDIIQKGDEYSRISYEFLLRFSNVIKRTGAAKSVSPDSAVSDVVEYVEEHYRENISLEQIAAAAGLSKEYLCAVFKREMGQTIVHFLTTLRIGCARELLEEYPEKRAYEIGRMCGYENPSYFGKVFKEIVGVTPEQYRRIT